MENIFFIASVTWLAVISPGADFAIVSRNSAVYGRKAGLASSLGIASGCWVHVAYAVFGLGLIVQFFPDLLYYVRIIGAIYLIYIGIETMRSSPISEYPDANTQDVTNRRCYTIGFFTNSLNPKTSVFVVSLYSQVIGESTSLPIQLLWGGFISLSHFIWFAGIAVFMSTSKIRAQVLKHQKILNMIIGFLLAILGVALFMSNNIHF